MNISSQNLHPNGSRQGTSLPAILEIQNLRTQFETHDGLVHAVNGISYTLHAGETLGVVGESGCGKSVSMLSVMRLLPQPPARIQADAIQFHGKDLLAINDAEMRHLRGSQIAMIFQDPMTSLNPVLTIGYQLIEPLRVHRGLNEVLATAKAAELLSLVGIPDAANRLNDYPHQFSGGMRQRAMIAMGLACNPSLLIADEPTTALDVTIQAQIVDLVKNLRDQFDMALVWITHDLGVVAGLADRVIVMYAGFIVEDAPVDELYEHPSHPYTWSLLRSLPAAQMNTGQSRGKVRGERLEAIKGMPPDLVRLPSIPGCPFAPRCKFVKEPCLRHNPPLREISTPAALLDEPGTEHAPFYGPHKAACWVNLETGELR